jgi:hypothetical protein
MRTLGILVGLAGAIVAVACLDAGMSPPAGRTASAQPATTLAPEPTPSPTTVTPSDLTPASAQRPAPPAVAPTVPPAPPPIPAVVEHKAPNGVTETCQLLEKFPFEPADVTADPTTMRWYRVDDFEDVSTLCAMDLYAAESTDTATAVGVCPKLHWSTPALEIFELGDRTKAGFEKARCPRWRYRKAKKLAKMKAPVYAKETESALMYFHFSRLLGNAGLVYPATFRTVARTELVQWSRDALGYIEKLTTDATPRDGWGVLRSRHTKRKTADVVGTSLAKNPRGEDSHHAFKYFPDQKTRIGTPDQFRKQSYVKLVSSRRSIAEQLDLDPKDPVEYREELQALAYGHDFTNLVIMDHLFNQRDRAGNIHSRVYNHFVDDDGHLRWKKKPKDRAKDKDRKPKQGADPAKVSVPLERLILKDNDDGLVWNMFGRLNSSRLIPDLRHLDSTMYARIQWLAGLMKDPATSDQVRDYFVESVKVQESTYNAVSQRLVKLAERFAHAHDIGKLQLDLDLDAVVAQAPALPAKSDDKRSRRRSRRSRDR